MQNSPTDRFGLTKAHRGIVEQAIRQILQPGQSVRLWIFGSRARGEFQSGSDIDLLVDGQTPLSSAQLGELREILEESALRFKVDVVPEAALYEGYADRILGERQLFLLLHPDGENFGT